MAENPQLSGQHLVYCIIFLFRTVLFNGFEQVMPLTVGLIAASVDAGVNLSDIEKARIAVNADAGEAVVLLPGNGTLSIFLD